MTRLHFLSIIVLLLNACGEMVTTMPPVPSFSPTETELPPTSTHIPSTPTKINNPVESTPTPTPGPIIDSLGNITWHPQNVLIMSEGGGGDGVSYNYPPEFVLLWDGTLLQQGENYLDAPYISHIEKNEMCKILNTIDTSGFFEEPSFYNFPFDGLGSHYISVNAWKSNTSGAQVLNYALSGAPYYDGLFCRKCPFPPEETIIKPGLANVYYFLENYVSTDRKIAPIEKLLVYFFPVDDDPSHEWPINSISLAELAKECESESLYCYDTGLTLEGSIAKEFQEKIRGDQVFRDDLFMNSTPFRISYRAIWPYEDSIMYSSVSERSQLLSPPIDYTLTCNSSFGQYPILPLTRDNKFWMYSPDGKWGAEVVDKSGDIMKIRVVNKSGYEKLYQYEPSLFGRKSLKVFPRIWTSDGEFFIVNILSGDFDAQKTPFVNSMGLQRISISNGKVNYMFAGVDGQEYAYTMSEDGRQVVYIRQEDRPLKITIKDTYSLNEKTVTLSLPPNKIGEYTNAGSIVWSVDKKTIYIAAIYSENETESGYLIGIDVSNPVNQNIIYERSTPFKLNQFAIFDWGAGICNLDEDVESYCSTRLNLENGSVSN